MQCSVVLYSGLQLSKPSTTLKKSVLVYNEVPACNTPQRDSDMWKQPMGRLGILLSGQLNGQPPQT
jgi:hypothetical protein